MADNCIMNFFYFSLLFSTTTLGDLDLSKSYIEYGLDNADICNPAHTKVGVIEDLRKYRDAAIMVKPSHVFDTWSNVRYNKLCKFRIKATKGDGLFAVIQRMSFRRNGSECLDYITFTQEDGRPSQKYCGKLDFNMTTPGMYEEFNFHGKITTEIFISKQPLLPGESLDLVVTYTPCRDCKFIDFGEHSSFAHPYNIHISTKFICDGHINCVSSICSDEKNCTSTVNRIESDGIGTKVTVSAVATISLCFIIFILCLWICRKHEILCWSPDCAGPSHTVTNSNIGLPMERGEQSASNPPYVSTAPMLEIAVPTSHHDKDLPPSYDSLFPTQTNSINT